MLGAEKVTALCKRFDRIREERQNWEGLWQDLADLLIPCENEIQGYLNYSNHGSRKGLKVYDGSAMHYNDLLASAIFTMLINPATEWCELRAINRDSPEIRADLQKLTSAVHELLRSTNFYCETPTFLKHLCALGSGHMWIFDDPYELLRFDCRPVYEVFWGQGVDKRVNTCFSLFKMKNREVLEKYEDVIEDTNFKESLDKNPDDYTELLRVILPREDREFGKLNKENKPWAHYIVIPEKKICVYEGGFDSIPFAALRWSTSGGEVYGRGPGGKVLADAKMLQEMMKVTIRAAQKVVDPPLLVPDSNTAKPDLRPGGITVYRAGTQDFTRPLLTNSRPDIGMDIMADVRNRMKEGYWADKLQLRDGPQMTATEVNARLDEAMKLLGPVVSRIEREFLSIVVSRCLSALAQNREYLKTLNLKTDIMDAGGTVIVRFSSQMAKALRNADIGKVNQFIATVAQIAQFKPEVLDKISGDAAVTYLSDAYSVPAEIMMTDKQVQEVREAKAEQAQAQQQQQQQMVDAQTMKDMGVKLG